ncbi:MAG: Acetylornithine aminotransferase Ornithine aminotransferase [Pseudomonas sp.]|nr:Acetylornithine aminotransferase Ornithine aminotransferase [Pseudomonas sp.]
MNVFKLLFGRQALAEVGGGLDSVDDAYAGLNRVERLRRSTSSDQVHIVDTAEEARDVAIWLTRNWGQQHRRGDFGLISTNPGVPGAVHVPVNDLAAVHAAIDSRTVAIILEPIRSTAEALPAARAYFQGVAQLCRELKILLILDETRTSLGRLETLLCEERCGIRADLVVLGSGVEGSTPVAAVLARGTAVGSENWGVVAA